MILSIEDLITEDKKFNIKNKPKKGFLTKLHYKLQCLIHKNKSKIKFIKIYFNVSSVMKLIWDIMMTYSYSSIGMVYVIT